jgi:hypothetical protein
MARDRIRPGAFCSALLVAVLGWPAAGHAAEPTAAQPEVAGAAVRRFVGAHLAERRRSDVYAEIGKALRDTRLLLRDLLRSDVAATSEGAELVEAALIRVRALLDEATDQAAGDRGALQHLAVASDRLRVLEARVAEIVAAPSPGVRAERAQALVLDVEAAYPVGERLFSTRRSESSFYQGEPGVQRGAAKK